MSQNKRKTVVSISVLCLFLLRVAERLWHGKDRSQQVTGYHSREVDSSNCVELIEERGGRKKLTNLSSYPLV